MRRVIRKIWLGVGSATLASAPVTHAAGVVPPYPRTEQAAAPHVVLVGKDHPPGTAGAQGGETYLRDGGPSDTRVRVLRDLLLIEGHFRIVDELVAAGRFDEAVKRMGEMTLEAREKVEPYMKGQGVKPFTPLVAETQTALSKSNLQAFKAGRKKLDERIVQARAAFKKFQTPHYRFALRGIVETLKAAASSYDASVQGGLIVSASEYQDGRGYVLAAELALSRIETGLTAIDAGALREIKTALIELKRAWPSLAPPTSITMSADGPTVLAARIEELAEPFWGSN